MEEQPNIPPDFSKIGGNEKDLIAQRKHHTCVLENGLVEFYDEKYVKIYKGEVVGEDQSPEGVGCVFDETTHQPKFLGVFADGIAVRHIKDFHEKMMVEFDDKGNVIYRGLYYDNYELSYPYHMAGVEYDNNGAVLFAGRYNMGKRVYADESVVFLADVVSNHIESLQNLLTTTADNQNALALARELRITYDQIYQSLFSTPDERVNEPPFVTPGVVSFLATNNVQQGQSRTLRFEELRGGDDVLYHVLAPDPFEETYSAFILRHVAKIGKVTIIPAGFKLSKTLIVDDCTNVKRISIARNCFMGHIPTTREDGSFDSSVLTTAEPVKPSGFLWLKHLPSLEELLIGNTSFVLSAQFKITDCDRLRNVVIGSNENGETDSYSFASVAELELKDLGALETFSCVGNGNFYKTHSISLFGLPSLTSLEVLGKDTFVGTIENNTLALSGTPRLTKIIFPPSESFTLIPKENAGSMDSFPPFRFN